MNEARSSLLYISEDTVWGQHGRDTVTAFFPDARCLTWRPGEEFPRSVSEWRGRWIISFKSDLVLPVEVIESAASGAINFHPAPPKYRGLGGYELAIHNGDEEYGVTCHYMVKKIDYGPIIRVRRFPIAEDNPLSLRQRAAAYCLSMLNDIVAMIYANQRPKTCAERWNEELYTMHEVKRMCRFSGLPDAGTQLNTHQEPPPG